MRLLPNLHAIAFNIWEIENAFFDGRTRDDANNLIEYTDPLGQTTRWRYTRAGDPLERIDALGQRLTYTYDAAGRLVRLTNENGQHTHFRYDAISTGAPPRSALAG